MPFSHGSAAKLYSNGWDLTSFMREGTPSITADVADASVWGLASKKYVPGKTSAVFSGSGIWDADSTTPGTTDKIDEVLSTILGNLGSAVHCPQGDVLGAPAFIIDAAGSAYEITSPNDDVTAVSFELQSNAGNAAGRVLRPSTGALGITAGGNGSNVDDQSYKAVPGATTFGGYGALQVVAKGGGAGTITVTIESSVNGSTGWAVICTFAGVTTAHGNQVVEVPAGTTINRYLRAVWAVTGGTWDIHVAFARRQS